jgi:hypothetical protein
VIKKIAEIEPKRCRDEEHKLDREEMVKTKTVREPKSMRRTEEEQMETDNKWSQA